MEFAFSLLDAGKRFVDYKDKILFVDLKRLEVFRDNRVCVNCGLEGNLFAIQISGRMGCWHINMWHKSSKNEMLFTLDHVLPKSKGGNDDISNLQTMCSKCNQEKDNKITFDGMNMLIEQGMAYV